ncbi:Actin-related protein 6 [Recurvomyces mirabilis]|uniref:Actin-like protein ARP6 n=1 Tax=Recurvomyces mirabilis TaxID=574656 RepID=A0AAE0WJR2_9PEZI|nr:Actin-related protein 6 [Recurvomyces mirabilis]KAK5150933.1 Actin- protein 6 [Recurvomyces mirabilis]
MARPKSVSSAPISGDLADKTLVLDNGAHTIKAGLAVGHAENEPSLHDCHVIPNVIARSQRDKRTYIGPEYSECLDFGELAYKRPVEKGFIVNWEGEKAIWERSFFDKNAAVLQCVPEETNLILTEAPNSPTALQRHADEMVFEEFGFAGYYRTIAPTLNAYAPSPFPSTSISAPGIPVECLLVVDAGHSHTTITPLYQGRPFQAAIRRLEVGGKTLTNQMKELISRTFDVHREDHIVGEIKEDVCFVSQDFNRDLEKVWKGGRYDPREIDASVVVDYVLPDYETIKRGFARPHDPKANLRNIMLGIGTEGGRREHVLTIGNERFVVPELLFRPSDIGMQQDGICGTILQAINALPEVLRQAYLANIVVVGGTSKLPGFVERLEAGLRGMVDVDLVVRVARAGDLVKNVWLGGARMAQNEELVKSLLGILHKARYIET